MMIDGLDGWPLSPKMQKNENKSYDGLLIFAPTKDLLPGTSVVTLLNRQIWHHQIETNF